MLELETVFTVTEQSQLLLYAVLLGIPLGICFDILRTLRLLIPHGTLATALEDIGFLLLSAGALLCFSVVLARGEVRGYYAMGAILGFLLYHCTLGSLMVSALRRILGTVGKLLQKLFSPALHGSVRIYSILKCKFVHFAKVLGKIPFFRSLPLNENRKMLYNKKEKRKRRTAKKWQKKKSGPDGS